MSPVFITEQLLNGIGYGLMLFLLAAGLTLVFGIMDVMNLAHGSLYMVGAYVAARAQADRFVCAGLLLAVLATAVVGLLLEHCWCGACTGATTCRRCWPPSA